MADNHPNLLDKGRVATTWRQTKVRLLQAKRLVDWARHADQWPAAQKQEHPLKYEIYRHEQPILRNDEGSQPEFEAGKLANLRLAVRKFDGVLLSAEQPLSFWRTLGKVTEAQGYRYGMELRGGCIVPALGGGLCLLSNALFAMAARTGCKIIERHGHTMEAIPPGLHELWGLDATVFWPYVDLRFATREGRVHLQVRAIEQSLQLVMTADQPLPFGVELQAVAERVEIRPEGRFRSNKLMRKLIFTQNSQAVEEEVLCENRKILLHQEQQRRNCLTCGEVSCHSRVTIPPAQRMSLDKQLAK